MAVNNTPPSFEQIFILKWRNGNGFIADYLVDFIIIIRA